MTALLILTTTLFWTTVMIVMKLPLWAVLCLSLAAGFIATFGITLCKASNRE